MIVGGVIGGLVLLVLAFGVAYFVLQRHRKSKLRAIHIPTAASEPLEYPGRMAVLSAPAFERQPIKALASNSGVFIAFFSAFMTLNASPPAPDPGMMSASAPNSAGGLSSV